jgi:hypothetical protein
MNAFQYLAGALMLVLVVTTLRGAMRGGIRKRVAVFWLLVWAGAGVAAMWPRSTMLVARALGIGRGADLILYSSVFVMLIGFFYVYTRFRKLDRAFTLLVRELAIEHPISEGRLGSAPGRDRSANPLPLAAGTDDAKS